MPSKTTPTFITEIPLRVSSHERAILGKRFFAAKQQYNALLGQALKRLEAMRSDSQFLEAKKLYKAQGKKEVAQSLFKKLSEKHGYRKYDLQAFCKQWNTKRNFLSIGSALTQKLAHRAFESVKEYELKKRGRPRFKGYRGMHSIEDKQPTTLRLKDNHVHYLGLKLLLLYNPQDPVHYHGMNAPLKYIRLVRRNFNGRKRYFAQLVCEGAPWIKSKNKAGKATVGLDIGPQTIAIVSPEKKYADLRVFADELRPLKKERKKLQQKIARQLRKGNPTCYQADVWQRKDKHWCRKQGKSIKGKRLVNRSITLKKTTAKLADIARRQAAYRKTQHGKLVNEILRTGDHIKTEKLSYKAFQRLFGSSVGLRAPGMFVELLKRKAENAGGKVEEVSTYKTKLSQACHCGNFEKKPLSQRWHKCSCGVEAQRDLYSAYLASFVEKDTLIVDQAKKAWSGMDIALHTAMSKIKHASSRPLPASLGLQKLGSERVVCAVS